MSYDPTLPVANSPISSAELRAQFAGLKDLIDALPASDVMQEVIIAQSAGNCMAVSELNLTVSDPPTQAEVQAIADRLDQLLFNLRRE